MVLESGMKSIIGTALGNAIGIGMEKKKKSH